MDSFQEVLFKLKRYWSDRGAIIQEPYDLEVGADDGAGDLPAGAGPQALPGGYVQPSRRPADGRYGENPNRLLSTGSFK